jgi:heat shock protein HslJ/uncharacterized lipoprotein NlpE involved in copper resistance
MDRFKFLIPIVLLLLCFAPACSGPVSILDQEPAGMSNERVAQLAIGAWSGTIPCADCPGIAYSLELNADSTYRERMVYQGRSATPFVQSGTWGVSNGRVLLNKKGSRHNQFAIEGEALVMLDGEGNPIDSQQAEAYRLQRKKTDEAEDNPRLWREKYERGIDFAAVGNEPFWSLEIDLEKMIEFRALDEEKGSVLTPVPLGEKPTTGEGIVYKVQTVTGDMEVQLLKQACEDNMSGRAFPYTVTVTKDGTAYKGCGMYLRDSRLNGTWNLQQLQGKALDPKQQPGAQPTLTISLADNRVSGNAGCNRISGNMEPIGDRINFGPVAATKMACPNMELENQFLRVLSEKELRYRVSDEQLELFLNAKPVMIFGRGE